MIISPAVTVAVEDAYGITVAADSSAVTLTMSSGTFSSGNSAVTAAAVNGVATFSGLVLNTPGSYTLAASDGALTGATSSSFTITITASTLAFLAQPTSAVAGVGDCSGRDGSR